MPLYFMMNKPSGCITARTDPRHKTVMDYLPENLRDVVFPVGRLDKDTEGLLLFTDDGALNYRLLSPESHVPKTYLFYSLGTLDDEARKRIEGGVRLYPTREIFSAPAVVTVDGTTRLADIKEHLSQTELKLARRRPDTPVVYGRVTVTEGKKHQVKRMLMSVGAKIVYLKRIAMGALTLDPALGAGEYRPLTQKELLLLLGE